MDLEEADEPMALQGVQLKPSEVRDHGLKFINDDWNGSIANGQAFKLQWNDTIEVDNGDLRLFKIRYPKDGVVNYEQVSNLTEFMVERSCIWTPEGLEKDELYTILVSNVEENDEQWAMSPVWKPTNPNKEKPQGFHWSNPIGIPIVTILGIYFLSLATCLLYRRRRNRKRARERELQRRQYSSTNSATPMHPDDRHPSVGSVVTVQTYTEEDELVKKDDFGTWIVQNPSPPPIPRPSQPGVQWNRMVWRRDSTTEGEPTVRPVGSIWNDGWDHEGPIGQAH